MRRRFLWGMIVVLLVLFGLYHWVSNGDTLPSWKAEEKSTSLSSGHYDVAIIGGGIGGLTSGALLAKNGYKVVIVERNPTIGGFCAKHTEGGFTFGYGAGDIDGIWERGPLTYLLKQLKLDQKTLFVRNSRRFFVGGSSFDVNGRASFEEALSKQFPEEKEAISTFFEKAKIVYEEAYDTTMIDMWGIRIPDDLITTAMPSEWVEGYTPCHKEYLEWSKKSYQDVLDEHFKSSKLKKVMSSFLRHLGGLPVRTRASEAVVHTFGYFFFGGYHALETPYHFAKTLSTYITNHGGTIVTNTTVDTILVEHEAVKGIQSGKRTFYAPTVISNVNAKTTYLDLVDEALSSEFLKSINQIPLGRSAFALYLGIDADLSAYPSILQDRDNQIFISNKSKNDPTLAPKGKSAIVLRESARIGDFMGKNPTQYKKYVQRRSEALLEKGVALMPELLGRISFKTVKTPMDFEAMVAMPQGAVYGFDLAKAFLWPHFKSPIRGLYLVGASSGGPGVKAVVSNGILCVHDIMGWKKK